MSESGKSSPRVFVVGDLPEITTALTDYNVAVSTAQDVGNALETIPDQPIECVVTSADPGAVSGVELAAILHGRSDISTVVVGDVDAPVEDAAGVSNVYSRADPEKIVETVQSNLGTSPSTALSEATVAALEDLYQLEYDTQSLEQWLEAVVEIGCRRLGLPYGFVTRIDDDTQYIVTAVGDHEGLQTGASAPLSESYCKHTIESDDIVGFRDVRDVEWVDSDAIARFGLSCYLGGRIELDEPYGTICFADHETRPTSFSAEEQTFVKLLTKWVRYELLRHERQSELRLKNRAMDEAEIGITISDYTQPDNPIIYANNGFEQITGYSTEEATGRNCRYLQGERTDPETTTQIREAIDAGESVSVELRNYRKDGTEFWNHLQIYPITQNGEVTNFVGFQRDITERKERERELRAYETAINTAADGVYQLSPDGRFQMVNDAVCSITGYDREQLLGASLDRLLSEEDVERTQRRIADALQRGERDILTMTVTVERQDGTTLPAETRIGLLTEDGTHTGTVMVTRDISDRRTHEQTLTELHDVSRDLLGAESTAEISRTVAAAAAEILDIEVVAVYRFDEQDNRLRPEAVPEQTESKLDDIPVFGPGKGIAWDVFVSGERRIYDDVSADPDAYNPETPIRSELLLPIGDYGVLICGSTVPEAYNQQTAELADLLVANAQAAYDRMEREQRLHRRERELREKNQRLERLDEINDRIRRISHELVGATTREEIEELVCDGLTAIDSYTFAWIGEPDHTRDTIDVRTIAGRSDGYVDEIDRSGQGTEPTVTTASDGESTVFNRIADDLRQGTWRREALNRDYRAVASIPIQHSGIPYGALSIYADTTDVFDDETQTLLEEFAETVAHSIAAVELRKALLSDEQVELVFGIGSQPTTMFGIAETLDQIVTVSRMVPRSDGGVLLYGTVGNTTVEAFERCCGDRHDIESVHAKQVHGDAVRFELHVTGSALCATVADYGGSFERLTIRGDEGRLIVTVPSSGSVNEFIDLFTQQYEGSELLARRESGSETESTDPLAELTDRQREVLTVAYERGFYGWPRESTGEELAKSLDISAPTFLEHLRRAEAKLIDQMLGDGTGPS
jgi:PAS domain S-box-containing protein